MPINDPPPHITYGGWYPPPYYIDPRYQPAPWWVPWSPPSGCHHDCCVCRHGHVTTTSVLTITSEPIKADPDVRDD